MRIKLLFALAILTAFNAQAQLITYTNLYVPGFLQTASLTVQPGQIAKVIGGNADYGYNQLRVTVGTNTFARQGVAPLPVVSGPATISVVAQLDGGISDAYYTSELDTPVQPVPLTPGTAVVIPADSGGPVNIILESSVELINWTAALPGSYGTSTTNRFFRVRAQRTQ